MTLDEILTPELKAAWQRMKRTVGFLPPEWFQTKDKKESVNAIRDLVALAMEQEWQRTKMKLEGYQPRAFYKWPDWQRAAEERLEKGNKHD